MRATAHAAVRWVYRHNPLVVRPAPGLEAAYVPQPRAITGFFESLSSAQKSFVLSYRGEESHGDSAFGHAKHVQL